MAGVLTNTDTALRRCWHPVAIQPETNQTCRLFTTLWRDALDGDEERMAVAFELEVLREDLQIQEAYHELELPLDPTAGVHTWAHRATLEPRRVRGDLVAAVEGDAQ